MFAFIIVIKLTFRADITKCYFLFRSPDGVYLGLILEFNLTASSYATMAIREITKMDMSSHFQTTLNDAGVGKHEAKKLKEESAGPV